MISIQYPISKIKNGFTLIEVLIAIFILSMGILAVLAMFPLGIQVAKSSEMATIATQLTQEKIEEIVSKSYEEISVGTTTESALPFPFNAYGIETQVTCFDPNNSLSPNCPDDTGIKKIKVTVSWESPLGVTEKSIKITTLISKR